MPFSRPKVKIGDSVSWGKKRSDSTGHQRGLYFCCARPKREGNCSKAN